MGKRVSLHYDEKVACDQLLRRDAPLGEQVTVVQDVPLVPGIAIPQAAPQPANPPAAGARHRPGCAGADALSAGRLSEPRRSARAAPPLRRAVRPLSPATPRAAARGSPASRLRARRCRDRRLCRGLHRARQQVCPARLALAGRRRAAAPQRAAAVTRAMRQFVEECLDRRGVAENGCSPLGRVRSSGGRLRPAQHQRRQQRHRLLRHAQARRPTFCE